MIVEHAILNIKKGRSREFEEALTRVHSIIEQVPGFQRMEIRPCVETKDRYLLLVWWKSLEAHTHGFRGSPGYQEWRETLHPFYEPFPVVQHYGAPIEYKTTGHS
jgi:heme-degrading monooxygenase HmoA